LHQFILCICLVCVGKKAIGYDEGKTSRRYAALAQQASQVTP